MTKLWNRIIEWWRSLFGRKRERPPTHAQAPARPRGMPPCEPGACRYPRLPDRLWCHKHAGQAKVLARRRAKRKAARRATQRLR